LREAPARGKEQGQISVRGEKERTEPEGRGGDIEGREGGIVREKVILNRSWGHNGKGREGGEF